MGQRIEPTLMKIQLKIDGDFRQRLADAVKNMPQAVRIGVQNATHYMQLEIAKSSPIGKSRVKGGLRNSWHAEISPLQGVVYTDKNYAIYVHEGTRPHLIKPKNGRALFWQGAVHPYRVIHHPGTKGNPFARRAFERNQNEIEKMFLEEIDKSLK